MIYRNYNKNMKYCYCTILIYIKLFNFFIFNIDSHKILTENSFRIFLKRLLIRYYINVSTIK